LKPVGTSALRDRVRKVRDSYRRSTGHRVHLVYAGVFDGESLWLAVESAGGKLCARDRGSGELVPLAPDLVEASDDQLAFRADLTGLRDRAPAEFDLVLLPETGGIQSLVGSTPAPGPLVTPPTRDGRHQFSLRHNSSDTLQLQVTPAPARAELVGLRVVPQGVELAVRGVPEPAALTLRTDAGVVRASFPMVVDDGVGRGVLTPEGLPATGPVLANVTVGAEESVPIGRRRNEMRHPNDAVQLPDLMGADGDQAVARLRWSPDGTMMIRLTCLEQDRSPEHVGTATEGDDS
jgi:hypothetical protein